MSYKLEHQPRKGHTSSRYRTPFELLSDLKDPLACINADLASVDCKYLIASRDVRRSVIVNVNLVTMKMN